MHPLWKVALGAGAVVGAGTLLGRALEPRRKIFVSFDYTNDKHYKFLLEAWDANKEFDLSFTDHSSGEVRSDSVPRVKAALATRIRESDVLLVIIGAEANKHHKDWMQIGFRNWINFEVATAKAARIPIVAVKLDKSFQSPEQLEGAGASWAMSFAEDAISKALRAV